MAIIFRQIYHPDYGIFNMIFGIDISWLEEPWLIMPSIIMTSVWQSAGFNMLYFLAGLQGIRRELYEAAEVDGGQTAGRALSM